MENNKVKVSVYRKIAIDISKDISNGKYIEGQILSGRTTLSSYYKVSPETIRKAIHILNDVEVVSSEHGKGVIVKSKKKAKDFFEKNQEIINIKKIKSDIIDLSKTQVKISESILENIRTIIDFSERFDEENPFIPYQIKIKSNSKVIGKTVDEIHFWHNTGATVIAIKRNDEIILSPGPYATFFEDDLFYIVGVKESYLTAKSLLE